MKTPQRRIEVSHWLGRHDTTTLLVWPMGHGCKQHPELASRITLAIDTGDASVHLRITAVEALQLMSTLRWALADGVDPYRADGNLSQALNEGDGSLRP